MRRLLSSGSASASGRGGSMLEGMLVLWFILTVCSAVYVGYDLYANTPALNVMKIAWVLVVLYTGPVGLFLYLITCRQPLPETHDEFIAPLWKQSLGSEVHCLAGDATGIIAAAFILSFYAIPMGMEIAIEYMAGFLFGLLIFQALFMKGMMGEGYVAAVKTSLYPEWVSMNMIMAGMIPVMVIWSALEPFAADPASLHFWGKMSFATLVGGVLAYPMNYWLVAKGLKHGMVTAPKKGGAMHMKHVERTATARDVQLMMWVSLAFLVLGCLIAIMGWALLTAFS
jgi:hypothetical protein